MDGRRSGTSSYKFKPGDRVAIASRAAVYKIRFDDTTSQDINQESCLQFIGTVESVNTTGHAQVTFGKNIRCTIELEALLKMPDLWPGTLVKVVNDIRGNGNLQLGNIDWYHSQTEICGGIVLALESSTNGGSAILVTLGKRCSELSPLYVDVVARPLYGDFRARVTEYACDNAVSDNDVSAILVQNVFNALQKSMQDLPDVHIFPSSTSSQFSPGDVVKVSSDVKKSVEWHQKNSLYTMGPSTTCFETQEVNNACSGHKHSKKSAFPIEQLLTLREPGTIVHVNSECEAIVEFRDGRAWCIRSSFLHRVDGTNTPGDGTRTISPQKLSERFHSLVDYALRNQNQKFVPATLQECFFAACFSGNKNVCKDLLTSYVDIDCEDANGNKALHYAAHGSTCYVFACSSAPFEARQSKHYGDGGKPVGTRRRRFRG